MRISFGALNSDIFISWWFFGGDGFQVGIEAVETFFPVDAVLLHPVGGVLQAVAVELAGAPLRVAGLGDQAGLPAPAGAW
jgi:hypothetical protein